MVNLWGAKKICIGVVDVLHPDFSFLLRIKANSQNGEIKAAAKPEMSSL